jgi:hypothetical protein
MSVAKCPYCENVILGFEEEIICDHAVLSCPHCLKVLSVK